MQVVPRDADREFTGGDASETCQGCRNCDPAGGWAARNGRSRLERALRSLALFHRASRYEAVVLRGDEGEQLNLAGEAVCVGAHDSR